MRGRLARLAIAACALGAGVLCAAAVALPAAGSEPAPTVEAVNSGGLYGTSHYWTPGSVTIAPGGAVTLANSTAVPHGVRWVGGPAVPACAASVPVGTGPASSGTGWSGACTFTTPGEYTFYCTVHGPEMTGRVIVAGPTPPAPTTPAGTTGATAPAAPAAGGPGAQEGAGDSEPLGALAVSAAPRRGILTGSLLVAGAGAGGQLVLTLLAHVPGVAGHRATSVTLAHLMREHLAGGVQHFAVALGARGRRLLRRLGRLSVSLTAQLLESSGRRVSRSRTLLLTPRALR